MSRITAGRKAQSKGALFESMIEHTCKEYERKGLAHIQKTPEPTRYIRPYGKNGQFIAHFIKQAQPDFKGVLKGGKSVLFEAKRTEGTSIPKNKVSDAQLDNLRMADSLGAECFILVSFKEKKFYKVPYGIWEQIETIYEKKSLNEKDLKPFEVPYVNGRIAFLKEEKK